MTTVEKLISQQSETQRVIANSIKNVKKAGKSNHTAGFLQSRMELLENYWKEYRTAHLNIATAISSSDENYADYFDSYDLTEESYLTSLDELKEMYRAVNTTPSTSKLNDSKQSAPTTSLFNLPPLKIPTFSGDVKLWAPFRDLFRRLIHNNESLSDIHRLHYLKNNLSGDAERQLRHIELTDANYVTAWAALENRYDNPRISIKAHLSSLLSIAPVKNESANEIKRLLDSTIENVNALRNMGRDVWDDIVVHLTVSKLDVNTQQHWERHLGRTKEMPTFQQLEEFLETTIYILEPNNHQPIVKQSQRPSSFLSSQQRSSSSSSSFANNKPKVTQHHSHHVNTQQTNCCLCDVFHSLSSCPAFKRLNVTIRQQYIHDSNLCINCLRSDHKADKCTSKYTCRHCRQRHHSLLHLDDTPINNNNNVTKTFSSNTSLLPATSSNISFLPTPSSPSTSFSPSYHVTQHSQQSINADQLSCSPSNMNTSILLSTAWVSVVAPNGKTTACRALLDQGSEVSFISEKIVQLLQLPKTKANLQIMGINSNSLGSSRNTAQFTIRSNAMHNNLINMSAYVLPKVSNMLPSSTICTSPQTWSHLHGLVLADPEFYKPKPIELLIGADLYGSILLNDVRNGIKNTPTAQKTIWGYILSGPVSSTNPAHSINVHHNHAEDIDQLLQRFWEIEDLHSPHTLSATEQQCETFYAETHKRSADGTYIVRLPLISQTVSLGSSRSVAVKRLHHMERRFQQSHNLRSQYSEFMNDYQQLNHMVPSTNDPNDSPIYYLPHHAVVKDSSSTTKLRVVFDASQQSSNGKSLNDFLNIGPPLQQDLAEIIIRWRTHRIAFSADIEKMYRQIRIADEDQDLQRILWRSNPSDPIQDFRLTTVTYGTSSAPYLAIRTLHQLAQDESKQFPMAAQMVYNDFYVDDLLSGADDIHTATQLQSDVIQMLKLGGFNLRKWVSNHPALLETLPDEYIEFKIPFNKFNVAVKTLGIHWSPSQDEFKFQLDLPNVNHAPTKRSMLSDIARLFDPLGWVSPVIIKAKLLLQRLWSEGIDWDDQLPPDLTNSWLTLRNTLRDLQHITMPRWIDTTTTMLSCQLHGFCDASESAYAAAVYVRTITTTNDITTHLIIAKSKVAPTKKISLPRLELCGAVLLAKLINKTKTSIKINIDEIFLWCDSMIALGWIKSDSRRWTTFVANRVNEIHTHTQPSQWNHITSDLNPADIPTRGLDPISLSKNQQWWCGPHFLQQPTSTWYNQPVTIHTDLESRKIHHCNFITTRLPWEIIQRFSTLNRMKRVTAYIIRFCQNTRMDKTTRTMGSLTTNELAQAQTFWIKQSQLLFTNSKSRAALKSLHPFADNELILRVGGRLDHSQLPYHQKHPIILPSKCHLSTLLIKHIHQQTIHGGTQITLNQLRERYWLLSARTQVRNVIKNCAVCVRQAAVTKQQLMGDLPSERVTPAKPFTHTGVDFAGPIQIRNTNGRGHQSHKAYIAVFVCFVTKATHIELVSDLSTAAFIAAFRRFCARRGLCTNIYSDNATNFVGADAELRTMFSKASPTIVEKLATTGTTWTFIPPSSPHFGGLWEAAVKSVKHHLKRIIGKSTLTYEEMNTLLTQIEAILNSRPLSIINDTDVNEPYPLTPGHFLIGSSILSVPEPSLLDKNPNHLNRWQYIQRMVQHFWNIWANEYLNQLQCRNKWKDESTEINKGDIVLIKSELTPPCKWPLGKILTTHPGQDGLTRVVTLQSDGKEFKRPITKLVKLPTTSNY